MAFSYTVTPLPQVWPGKPTPPYQQRRAPFKSVPGKAFTLLGTEIRRLGGKNVKIAIDVTSGSIRNDGMLYSNARPKSPGVIVSFDVPDGVLQFPCDTFRFWEANIDAIGRSLQALRMVNRYGVQQGKQYTGFKALPASTAPAATAATVLTTDAAAQLLANYSGLSAVDVLQDRTVAQAAARTARYRTHPDRTRSATSDEFQRVQTAIHLLADHHGLSVL